ncbi:MAG: hypothetical protein HFJ36_01315 [Clostridia bacterium]|nr:hypothetical protein [Clostridia bacterium]
MFHGVSVCGGITGEAYGNINHCFAKGTITASSNNVGGIIGIQTTPIQVEFVQGLADVYSSGVHVGTAAWGKNYSGGLYGRIDNITYKNHSYVQGVYTMNNSIITQWYGAEFVINDETPGIPKLKWE